MPTFQHGPYKNVIYHIWGQHWDSKLSKSSIEEDGNVLLKMRLKVHLRPIEMHNGPQAGYYQENDDRWNAWHWDRIAWNSWRTEWKYSIEQFWEEKFWLEPPEDYAALDVQGIRPNLSCSVGIDLLMSPGGAHQVFNVMAQGEHRANRVLTGGHGFTGWLGEVHRGSTPDTATKIVEIKDVGHLLAMPMVARDGYGANRYYRLEMPLMAHLPIFNEEHAAHVGVEEKGAMHKVQIIHALPWMKAAEAHTGVNADRWKVATRRPEAKQVSKIKADSSRFGAGLTPKAGASK